MAHDKLRLGRKSRNRKNHGEVADEGMRSRDDADGGCNTRAPCRYPGPPGDVAGDAVTRRVTSQRVRLGPRARVWNVGNKSRRLLHLYFVGEV